VALHNIYGVFWKKHISEHLQKKFCSVLYSHLGQNASVWSTKVSGGDGGPRCRRPALGFRGRGPARRSSAAGARVPGMGPSVEELGGGARLLSGRR